jgi:hypothetical protein
VTASGAVFVTQLLRRWFSIEMRAAQPAGVFRPNSVPCGPAMTSTAARSNTGKPFRIGFSCKTSSTTRLTGCDAFSRKSVFL